MGIDHVLVSFVTIATAGAIFSLQFTKNRLAARLCPDPLGELERSPRPLAAKRGPTSKGRGWEGRGRDDRGKEGRRKGRGREGRGKEGGKEKGREGEEGGRWPPNANFWIRSCPLLMPAVAHDHCNEKCFKLS